MSTASQVGLSPVDLVSADYYEVCENYLGSQSINCPKFSQIDNLFIQNQNMFHLFLFIVLSLLKLSGVLVDWFFAGALSFGMFGLSLGPLKLTLGVSYLVEKLV